MYEIIVIGIVIVVLIIYIYNIQFSKWEPEYETFIEDLVKNPNLKTGDLILYKAFNHFNSVFTGSYYGHIGVVYVPDDGTEPLIFEANGLETVRLKDHHSKRGIFLTPLRDRVAKYKGRCFWKALNKPLEEHVIGEFKKFICYAIENFDYDYNIVQGCLSRKMGIRRCNSKTDCAQLTFLSLIKLGLIDESEYDIPRLNHLKYTCALKELKNNYRYLDLIEIVDHPFAF